MRRRIQIALLYCFLALAVTLGGVEVAYAQLNSDSLISLYTNKMQMYLDKDGKAPEVFSFTKEGIEVFVPPTDTSRRKFDFILKWNKVDSFITDSRSIKQVKIRLGKATNPVSTKLPLHNYYICLDPGHMAGDLEMAKMEKKWVEMKSPPLKLIEGELTLATAMILKKKLELQGATVMLTRDKPNISAFGINFKKWKDSLFVNALNAAYARGDVSFEEKNYLLVKANNTEIFRRFFLPEDLRERAKRINKFQPDLTLIIHYNVDETNASWNRPTKKNFNMAFVGGSFTADELEKPEARTNFLRLLLTDDIERSIDFSKYMVESLVAKTGVPSALDSCAVYLKGNCLSTDVNGVFCRNLTLTRMVKGTLCYGESLYQDNVKECLALSKKEIKIGDLETSKRVEEVAEAYFQGILNYAKRKP